MAWLLPDINALHFKSILYIEYNISNNKFASQWASQSVQYTTPSVCRALISMRKNSPKNPFNGGKWKKPQEEQLRWDPFPRRDKHAIADVYTIDQHSKITVWAITMIKLLIDCKRIWSAGGTVSQRKDHSQWKLELNTSTMSNSVMRNQKISELTYVGLLPSGIWSVCLSVFVWE